MITKIAQRLVDIEREIKALRLSFHTGHITYGQAKKEVHELEEERDRLWLEE